jgi:hypothetical protein
MDSTQTSAVDQEVGPDLPYESFLRWTVRYAAIPDAEVDRNSNVDVTYVVTTVLGCATKIKSLRARCVAELPQEDASVFDVFESQALGLLYARARHLSAKQPSVPLPQISERAVHVHDILETGTRFAIKRGLLSASVLRDLRGTVGYRNLGSDLVMLTAIYRDNEAALAGRTGVTQQDVDEGEMLAYQVLGALGARDHLPVTVAATLDARQRASTLFERTYDAIQRIVTYLRWSQDDALEFAPSMHGPRNRKGNKDETPADEAPPSDTPSDTGVHAVITKNDIAVGMPGSSPFVVGE